MTLSLPQKKTHLLLFLGVVVMGVFLFVSKANADTMGIVQLDANSNSFNNNYDFESIAEEFATSTLTGIITEVQFSFKSSGSTGGSVILSCYQNVIAQQTYTWPNTASNGATTTVIIDTSTAEFNASNCPNAIQVKIQPSSGNAPNFQGSNTDTYANGSCISFDPTYQCSPLQDLFFEIYNNQNYRSVEIILPTTGFYGADFPYWNVQYTEPEATGTILFYVQYGNGSFSYQDIGSTDKQTDLVSATFQKLTALPTNAYQARVIAKNDTGASLATSSTIYFTINTNASTTFIQHYLNQYASTTPTDEQRCDRSPGGFFSYLNWEGVQYALCNAGRLLYDIPAEKLKQQAYGLIGLMQGVFPYSLLLDGKLLFDELTEPSQDVASSTIAIYLNTSAQGFRYGTNTAITLINTVEAGAVPFIDTIRYYLGAFMVMTWAGIMLYTVIKFI